MSISTVDTTTSMREFRAPRTMTPDELGDSLARLVWESFTDFLSSGDTEVSLAQLGVPTEDGIPDAHTSEEALIFILWCHTRAVQLAFLSRAADRLVKAGLDAMHRAVFEDMVENGTPRSHLPIFEQRVGARYSEYHAAAATSDASLGEVVVHHLAPDGDRDGTMAMAVAERALAVADPLRDFLEEVELIES